MTASVTPQAIAAEACQVIQRDGWTQGDFGNHDDGWCLVGACTTAALTLLDDNSGPLAELYARMRHDLGSEDGPYLDDVQALAVWNDHDARTEAEIVDLLTRSAEERRRDCHLLRARRRAVHPDPPPASACLRVRAHSPRRRPPAFAARQRCCELLAAARSLLP